MNMRISINPEDKERLLCSLQRDSQFLSKINILDYSLLVGIIENDEMADMPEVLDDPGRQPLPQAETVRSYQAESHENISNTII